MPSQEAFDTLSLGANMAIVSDSPENDSYLTDNSLEYLDLSHETI